MFQILNLKDTPILGQLRIEEALLRADEGNWCIINDGSPEAIVLGISGKPERLVDLKLLESQPIPLIKRFSGGGTVFVDPDTVFVTFICNEEFVGIPSYPHAIMDWTAAFYRKIFPSHFSLRENDYILNDRKFGGNAQYIRKKRWLHHSSLLWDFDPNNMKYLQMPMRTPEYRDGREHDEFLCCLRELFPSRRALKERVVQQLQRQFPVNDDSLAEIEDILTRPHRQATVLVSQGTTISSSVTA